MQGVLAVRHFICYKYVRAVAIKICSPTEHDVDLAPVAQLDAGAGHGQPAERGAAEIEVCAAAGADPAGALVGDDDGDGATGADAGVEAPNLVASAAALAVLEQHRAHRAHARLHRYHVHQRPVTARPACVKNANIHMFTSKKK
jgi:hypothetical protein